VQRTVVKGFKIAMAKVPLAADVQDSEDELRAQAFSTHARPTGGVSTSNARIPRLTTSRTMPAWRRSCARPGASRR